MQLRFQTGLTSEEYISRKVKAATSGEKALRIASADAAAHLILLDVMLPESRYPTLQVSTQRCRSPGSIGLDGVGE